MFCLGPVAAVMDEANVESSERQGEGAEYFGVLDIVVIVAVLCVVVLVVLKIIKKKRDEQNRVKNYMVIPKYVAAK